VKDRPTDNRDPSPEEMEQYGPFLDKQIEIIQPKAIVTLGRFSMQYIMNKLGLELELGPISKIHGKVFYAPVPYGGKKGPANAGAPRLTVTEAGAAPGLRTCTLSPSIPGEATSYHGMYSRAAASPGELPPAQELYEQIATVMGVQP